MSIADEIKQSFKRGSNLTKLIYINIGVFIFVHIILAIDWLSGLYKTETSLTRFVVYNLSLPDKPGIQTLWGIITYNFLHEQFWHLLSNLLWLYFLGRVFLQYIDQKKLITLYIAGGIVGGLFYLISYNIFPTLTEMNKMLTVNPDGVVEEVKRGSILYGASASVMAIVVGIATYAPNTRLNLILIGPVQLKYIALVGFLLTSVVDFSSNTGGKIAHIGGAFMGYIYFVQYKKGKDILKGFSKFLDSIFSFFKFKRSKMRVTYKKTKRDVRDMDDMEYNRQKTVNQEEVDRILDKIAKSGYSSLSKTEKETLFKVGKNN